MASRTGLLYQSKSYLKEHLAKIVSCARATDDKVTVCCDETIFYPQGGGQPTDTGCMASEGKAMQVSFVSYDRVTGKVSHEGTMTGQDFAVHEQVKMEIDWDKRYLHMRLHSGGHLIDHAIQFLGCPFQATKANHFPSGPSVEFKVTADSFPTDRPALDAFIIQLQAKCDELIAMDMPILVFEESAGQSDSSLSVTHIEKAKDLVQEKIRMVLFQGAPAAVPCGGTHVAKAGEIGRVIIRKVQFKDGIIRIAYKIE